MQLSPPREARPRRGEDIHHYYFIIEIPGISRKKIGYYRGKSKREAVKAEKAPKVEKKVVNVKVEKTKPVVSCAD